MIIMEKIQKKIKNKASSLNFGSLSTAVDEKFL
jgi:hypothetical protein